jgi:type I restriction enzyme R subunit
MPLNEADTRAQLIDPMLNRAGWTRSQVTREHYYRPDWQYTPGRIVLRGGRVEREKPRVIDYLLRYTEAFPIAVVEAKAEDQPASAGLEQAKRYARENNLMFAYATNGHEIIEWDGFTDTTRELKEFPSPEELWQRWELNTGIQLSTISGRTIAELRPLYNAAAAAARQHNPLLHPYAPPSLTHGSEPRYFQEAAIRETLVRIMRGQKRILLTMATGTGKTFTAMQIVWKLFKSGWLHQQKGRAGKILFLADREVLRNQAYNAFSPFASDRGDPRFLIDGKRRLSLQYDLYFGIYQTLWTTDQQNKRLFEHFPSDFFDLIIVDEAHRSGFGTWKEILDYFQSAIHLGMTATPRQDENVDTYAYFCAEEPAIPLDPNNPSAGVLRLAAYTYSLSQGIEDGFLATYKVHRVLTSVDKDGLHILKVREQGAEVIAPEDIEVRDEYHTPNFEREIRLPDRTQTMVRHLAKLLRQFGPMHKTMIFCVDVEHARDVARLLNNEFADLGLGDDYAVPIVSEEGDQAQRWLNQFQDSDRKTPVVATTAELLSTGVDVPSCRNIVFMKTISSPILFKQIIGRGSRLDPATGKLWFRIIDYTNASRLLDPQWDCPPRPVQTAPDPNAQTGTVQGVVRLESGEVIQGARVAVMAGPNDQRGPILTDEDGRYLFEGLPIGEITVIAYGTGLKRQQKAITTLDGIPVALDFELSPLTEETHRRIVVKNLQVTIAEEATFLVTGLNEPLTLEQYIDYSREKTRALISSWEKLVQVWQREDQRQQVQYHLQHNSVYPDVLAEVLGVRQTDPFDVLAYIAFERQPLLTREQRAQIFLRQHANWLQSFPDQQRRVIEALLEQYRLNGVEEMVNPQVFRLPTFRTLGGLKGISRMFGGDEHLRHTVSELQRRLYS